MHQNFLNLLLVGLDLKHGRLHDVEKAVKRFTHDRIIGICESSYGQYGVGILSTCNRFELYLILYNSDASQLVNSFYEAGIGRDSLYIKSGENAVKHLIEVACGRHSIAFGEAEILEQVKEAPIYGNNILERGVKILFRKTYETARKLREKLNRDGSNSIGKIAVHLLRSKLRNPDAKVMVVGYGTIGKKIVKELQKNGLSNIIVTTRNPEKITNNIDNLKIEKLDNLPSIIAKVDAVITATSSTHYLISGKTLENIPDSKKITIIDIALPRNVNPEVTRKRSGIELYNIEDLIPIAENLNPRTELVEELSRLATAEARVIFRNIKALEVEEVIRDIRSWVEEIRSRELARTLQLLTGDINHDRAVVETLSRRLVNKILHGPTVAIRRMAYNGYSQDYLNIIRKAFGVENETRN